MGTVNVIDISGDNPLQQLVLIFIQCVKLFYWMYLIKTTNNATEEPEIFIFCRGAGRKQWKYMIAASLNATLATDKSVKKYADYGRKGAGQ